tara:strand:- start:1621 stop:2418 length:798 start_codon:yes stop_codon:yes gene_type:complete
MTSWLECGQRFELERVLGAPQDLAWWFIGGNAVHTATEMLDKGEVLSPELAWNEAWREATNYLGADESAIRAGGRKSNEWPNKEDRSWWEHHGPLFTQSWFDWMAHKRASGWSLLQVPIAGDPAAVEVAFTMTLSDEVIVKGYVDRVMVDPNGQVVVVDLKTGSRPPKSSLQLAVYALGIAQTLDITPTLGGYWMARKADIDMLHTLTHLDEALVGSWFAKAKHGIESEIFIPRVTELCTSCTVAKYCPAVGGDKDLLTRVSTTS